MNKRLLPVSHSPSWHALALHHAEIASLHMRNLFSADEHRFSKFSLKVGGLFLDYSKNRITEQTLSLLFNLATSVSLFDAIDNLFSGAYINTTENRPALHTALRRPLSSPLIVDNHDVMKPIRNTLIKMSQWVELAHTQKLLGYSQKPITDFVNIGIGGSGLGPLMATEALAAYQKANVRCHFISSIDGTHLNTLLTTLNPETTLFIVSSKSFSTSETLAHAEIAKQWIAKTLGSSLAFQQHFVAVTANPQKAIVLGIDKNNIFELWEWVGGRYSLWSAVGLPLALMIGMDNFQDLLAGASSMDKHFRTTDIKKNMPIILGLLSLWYSNFFGAQTHAIIPYDERLKYFPQYLQQAEMESNGKNISLAGTPLDYTTAPILWGDMGCSAQHAFYQLLYQGTHLVPIDFITALHPAHPFQAQHASLFASCLSQSRALMFGKSKLTIMEELLAQGYSNTEAEVMAPHKIIPGNQPSNTILFHQLTPFTLGELIALYEHKVFVQATIWNINPFDQWGVELGKQISEQVSSDIHNKKISHPYDASTRGLLEYYCNAEVSLEEESTSLIK